MPLTTTPKSYEVAINLMQAHPNLKVIVSSSAVSAPAGARAVVANGAMPARCSRPALRATRRHQDLSRRQLAQGRPAPANPTSSAMSPLCDASEARRQARHRSQARPSRPARPAPTRSARAANRLWQADDLHQGECRQGGLLTPVRPGKAPRRPSARRLCALRSSTSDRHPTRRAARMPRRPCHGTILPHRKDLHARRPAP